jgi:hypothetical protein
MLPFVLKCARGWLFARGFEPTTCVKSWRARLNPFARFSNEQTNFMPSLWSRGLYDQEPRRLGLEAP